MLGFELDFWDYATFATLFLAGGAGVLTYIWIAGAYPAASRWRASTRRPAAG